MPTDKSTLAYIFANEEEKKQMETPEEQAAERVRRAAPELLAALERVVACAVNPRSPAMEAAREAIARARVVSA